MPVHFVCASEEEGPPLSPRVAYADERHITPDKQCRRRLTFVAEQLLQDSAGT